MNDVAYNHVRICRQSFLLTSRSTNAVLPMMPNSSASHEPNKMERCGRHVWLVHACARHLQTSNTAHVSHPQPQCFAHAQVSTCRANATLVEGGTKPNCSKYVCICARTPHTAQLQAVPPIQSPGRQRQTPTRRGGCRERQRGRWARPVHLHTGNQSSNHGICAR